MKGRSLNITKVFKFLWDLMEVYLPGIIFFAMFLLFVYQIVMRYVFREPLTWSFELTLLMYVYVVLLGSCHAERADEHVVFSLIYDKCSKKVQTWMRIIGTVILVVVLGMAVPSIAIYSWFIKTASIKTTTVLKIPYKYMYIIFLYMILSVCIRRIVHTVKDICSLQKPPSLQR